MKDADSITVFINLHTIWYSIAKIALLFRIKQRGGNVFFIFDTACIVYTKEIFLKKHSDVVVVKKKGFLFFLNGSKKTIKIILASYYLNIALL